MAAILIPHQARLRRVPVKDKSVRLFFKYELFIAPVNTLWEPFIMTIHQDIQTHDKKRIQWEPVNMAVFCKQALAWKIYLGVLEHIFVQI